MSLKRGRNVTKREKKYYVVIGPGGKPECQCMQCRLDRMSFGEDEMMKKKPCRYIVTKTPYWNIMVRYSMIMGMGAAIIASMVFL